MRSIAEIIKHSDYDIIAFQEVWSHSSYKVLVDELKELYPYYTKFSGKCKLTFGSGLVIFSKKLFLSVYSEEFEECRGMEIFAKKGFLAVNIIDVGVVINTHLPSGSMWFDPIFGNDKYDTQVLVKMAIGQILRYVEDIIPSYKTVYIMGDFNITYLSEEYSNSLDMFLGNNFYNSLHSPGYVSTVWGEDDKVVDYCFSRNTTVLTNTTNNFGSDIVEHVGLEITNETF